MTSIYHGHGHHHHEQLFIPELFPAAAMGVHIKRVVRRAINFSAVLLVSVNFLLEIVDNVGVCKHPTF